MKTRLAVAAGALLASTAANAQLAGDLLKGQTGLQAGTQAPEGLVVTGFVYDYHSTELSGPNGTSLDTTGHLNVLAAPGVNLWFVTPLKFFGGNYAAVLSLWGSSPTTEYPKLQANQSAYGFGDMYFKPVEFGWHTTYVDVITGFAMWIPTGRYTLGANDNTGQGQWGYEFSLGATLWGDAGHHFHLSAQAYYDVYTPKKNATVGVGPGKTSLQTGNIFTVEGGLGYQALGGGLNVGIPYTFQWKVTEDTLPSGIGSILPGIQAAKAWSASLGVETTLFWSETDGVTFRFLQTVAGANTSLGSSYFLFYNHIFYFNKNKT
ncbi:MAG TPA: transporter [Anaeromyxobacteraceae bacterium]|nr:transporter [Anaeromyxobacteraceae bacterium]